MAEIFGTDVTAHYQAQFGRDIQFSTGNATIYTYIENLVQQIQTRARTETQTLSRTLTQRQN